MRLLQLTSWLWLACICCVVARQEERRGIGGTDRSAPHSCVVDMLVESWYNSVLFTLIILVIFLRVMKREKHLFIYDG